MVMYFATDIYISFSTRPSYVKAFGMMLQAIASIPLIIYHQQCKGLIVDRIAHRETCMISMMDFTGWSLGGATLRYSQLPAHMVRTSHHGGDIIFIHGTNFFGWRSGI